MKPASAEFSVSLRVGGRSASSALAGSLRPGSECKHLTPHENLRRLRRNSRFVIQRPREERLISNQHSSIGRRFLLRIAPIIIGNANHQRGRASRKPNMKSSFFIVANRGNLKAYRAEKVPADRPPRMQLVQAITLPDAHFKPTDIFTDEAGGFPAQTGAGSRQTI